MNAKASAKAPTNPLDPVKLRCHVCESKWFNRVVDFQQHMKARHPNLTILLACEEKYLFCPSTSLADQEELTYRAEVAEMVARAAAVVIKALAGMGLKVMSWSTMAEI